MEEREYRLLRGFCPEQHAACAISVSYGVDAKEGRRKLLTYYCRYAARHGCASAGERGSSCPLVRRAARC